MSEVPNSEKTYPCQLVLLAMGFLGPEDTVFSQLKVDRDARSNVKAQNYATSMEKVYFSTLFISMMTVVEFFSRKKFNS